MNNHGPYRVKKGDKWSTLAKRFRLTTKELAGHNGRSVYSRLKLGEVINVPLPADEKLFVSAVDNMDKIRSLNADLLSSEITRKSFLANPKQFLTDAGIEIEPELIPKDMPVIRLMDDKEFRFLIESKDLVKVRKYLLKNYPDLISEDVRGPAHVADAVEAVAVALPAIAVADPIV